MKHIADTDIRLFINCVTTDRVKVGLDEHDFWEEQKFPLNKNFKFKKPLVLNFQNKPLRDRLERHLTKIIKSQQISKSNWHHWQTFFIRVTSAKIKNFPAFVLL